MWVIEPLHKVHHSGLSASRASYQRHLPPWLHIKADAFQHLQHLNAAQQTRLLQQDTVVCLSEYAKDDASAASSICRYLCPDHEKGKEYDTPSEQKVGYDAILSVYGLGIEAWRGG